MLTLPIINRHQCRTGIGALPIRYMEDYTVLGLWVDCVDKAVAVLRSSKYIVVRTGMGPAVELGERRRLVPMMRILTVAGIDCCLADVAEQIYQG